MIKVVTAPTAEPVTLQDVKLHCRVDNLEEDDLLNGLISAARQFVESQAGIRLVTQTLQDDRDGFPADGIIYLEGPAQAVTEIEYLDENGNWQTLSLSQVTLDATSNPARLTPDDSWPAVYGGVNCVSVTYTAGFGAPDAVPAIIKQALKMLVAHWHGQREAAAQQPLSEAPYAVESIIGMFRRGVIV